MEQQTLSLLYKQLWSPYIQSNSLNIQKKEIIINDYIIKETIVLKNFQDKDLTIYHYYQRNNKSNNKQYLLYLHSFQGNSEEILQHIDSFININFQIFCLEFSSIQNEVDYKTYSQGYYEKKDTEIVLKYIFKEFDVGKLFIWGRNMGANTAIQFSNDRRIKALVLDSVFQSLDSLIQQNLESEIKDLPKFVKRYYMTYIRKQIFENAKFDVKKLDLKIFAKNAIVPAFFIVPKNDQKIPILTQIEMFTNYKQSQKQMTIFEGDHFSKRPDFLINEILDFVSEKNKQNLKLKEIDVTKQQQILRDNRHKQQNKELNSSDKKKNSLDKKLEIISDIQHQYSSGFLSPTHTIVSANFLLNNSGKNIKQCTPVHDNVQKYITEKFKNKQLYVSFKIQQVEQIIDKKEQEYQNTVQEQILMTFSKYKQQQSESN